MRKLLLTTAAVAAAIAGAVAGETAFGTFTDTRDGQTYKTVKIGKHTWMAQNLNYQTKSGSWCYKDSTDNCNKYGRQYDWNTAKTVCPKGWKLPDTADWNRLVTTAGGWKTAAKKLKSKSGWNVYFGEDDEPKSCESGNGTDDFGFSALPGGYRFSNGDFLTAGKYGGWWTATEDNSNLAYHRRMGYDYDLVHEYSNRKGYGSSVRCIAARP